MLDFLVQLYEEGLGYSSLNTARCALSTFIVSGSSTIGAHPLVVRFLKGVFNARPTAARYVDIWDVSVVLNKLRDMSPCKYLSLKDLTLKLAMLMSLTSAQRGQTLHLLRTDHMDLHASYVVFHISSVIKTSAPGTGTPTIKFKAYAPDRRLCVVTYIKEYLKRTNNIRTAKEFFISYQKPHGHISRDTFTRWIRTIMCKSGIDISMYKPHSVRAAATSAAKRANVPLEDILKTAGWAGCTTFATYYDKPIRATTTFATAVLKT